MCNEEGEMTKKLCHVHVDDSTLIGEDVPFLMSQLEREIKITCKGVAPETFCGLQYA